MMQGVQKHDIARKQFQLMAAIVVGCLTLVSLIASFSIYQKSFQDWPSVSGLFALLITIGIEVAFIVFVRGMMRALIGSETPIAGVGALLLLVTMVVNMVTHHAVVTGVPLSGFQEAWIAWIGLTIPFLTILLFVLISWVSPEAKERRQERRMAFIGKQRALDFKEEYLNSEELEVELSGMKPMIAHQVQRYIAESIPGAPKQPVMASNTQRPIRGFAPPLDPQDSGKIAEQMRSRYFPRNPHTTGRLK